MLKAKNITLGFSKSTLGDLNSFFSKGISMLTYFFLPNLFTQASQTFTAHGVLGLVLIRTPTFLIVSIFMLFIGSPNVLASEFLLSVKATMPSCLHHDWSSPDPPPTTAQQKPVFLPGLHRYWQSHTADLPPAKLHHTLPQFDP